MSIPRPSTYTFAIWAIYVPRPSLTVLHALTTSARAAYIALHTDRLYMPKHPRCSPRNGNQTYWTIAVIALLLVAGCSSNDKSQNNENSALNLYVRGALDHQSQNDDAASRALESALRQDPNLIMARFLLGTIYREKGDYNSAAVQYERVVQLDPYT